jgi:sister-chromatid-cohesion protein PDS5
VAEDTIQAYIFPVPPKDKLDSQFEVSWVDRLLITMRFLDEKAIANMLAMTPLKSARPSVYEHYLGACAENNVSRVVDTRKRLHLLTMI